jgi:hypothetical protein
MTPAPHGSLVKELSRPGSRGLEAGILCMLRLRDMELTTEARRPRLGPAAREPELSV